MKQTLTSEDMDKPFETLNSFFECYHVHNLQNDLNKIEYQLYTKSYPHDIGSDAHDNTVFLFQQINDLIRASFKIHSRHLEMTNQSN